MSYELVQGPETVVRVGSWRQPLPWRLPAAPISETHRSDGGRWDAPAADFATLYLASDDLGAFIETLPYWRVSESFIDEVEAATSDDEPDPEFDPPLRSRVVTADYFRRVLVRVRLRLPALFVDVDHPRSHAQMNRELRSLLDEYDKAEFDRHVVMHSNRHLTRAIAGHLKDTLSPDVVGIRYESRRFRARECWALWDTGADLLYEGDPFPITPDLPALIEAAKILDLQLPAALPDPD